MRNTVVNIMPDSSEIAFSFIVVPSLSQTHFVPVVNVYNGNTLRQLVVDEVIDRLHGVVTTDKLVLIPIFPDLVTMLVVLRVKVNYLLNRRTVIKDHCEFVFQQPLVDFFLGDLSDVCFHFNYLSFVVIVCCLPCDYIILHRTKKSKHFFQNF
nr:MAG TPA: hypothetical protein [Caudoviricetes sp.]